uniref:Uncharacterized protein n=1 Tax=Octactis speculum TaxID=3111310 RepID=A0A7S2D6P5_9STRA|mmetsp:Transcript_44243/g.60431  ORF Transcript_44243/g.60431 Transcript_44243/m.60431 type:complete len:451 (+) Transcript_44243:111-1463(+)
MGFRSSSINLPSCCCEDQYPQNSGGGEIDESSLSARLEVRTRELAQADAELAQMEKSAMECIEESQSLQHELLRLDNLGVEQGECEREIWEEMRHLEAAFEDFRETTSAQLAKNRTESAAVERFYALSTCLDPHFIHTPLSDIFNLGFTSERLTINGLPVERDAPTEQASRSVRAAWGQAAALIMGGRISTEPKPTTPPPPSSPISSSPSSSYDESTHNQRDHQLLPFLPTPPPPPSKSNTQQQQQQQHRVFEILPLSGGPRILDQRSHVVHTLDFEGSQSEADTAIVAFAQAVEEVMLEVLRSSLSSDTQVTSPVSTSAERTEKNNPIIILPAALELLHEVNSSTREFIGEQLGRGASSSRNRKEGMPAKGGILEAAAAGTSTAGTSTGTSGDAPKRSSTSHQSAFQQRLLNETFWPRLRNGLGEAFQWLLLQPLPSPDVNFSKQHASG